ncbi:MAG: beta-propeller domain-containing protein, partial [Candidatus Bathyarchaeota archaeon]|nr:beta-propeller domain-containing protein [Candidatus Bathyarchaeota archaeon]
MAEPGRLRLTAYVFLGILCGSLILNAASSFNFAPLVLQYEPPGFNRFRSEAELKWFLEEKTKTDTSYGIEFFVFGAASTAAQAGTKADAATAAITAGATADSAIPDYSATNIQVAGVDEADIVKTDGDYIYLTRLNTVYIIKAYPADTASLVAKIRFSSEVGDLFISGDKLVVFVNGYGPMFSGMAKSSPYRPTGGLTEVYLYDVSDRLNPVLERTYETEGSYIATRMIGNFVYVVSQKGAWLYEGVLD